MAVPTARMVDIFAGNEMVLEVGLFGLDLVGNVVWRGGC